MIMNHYNGQVHSSYMGKATSQQQQEQRNIKRGRMKASCINPYLMNGFANHYQLDESTFILRGVRSEFYLLSHFLMKFL